MTYILAAERSDATAVDNAFTRYRAYLAQVADTMPPDALALATSAWYFDPTDHRCPHDGWLETFHIAETDAGSGKRILDVSVRLLGAYHDGYLTFRYRDVSNYRLEYGPSGQDVSSGHRDWRYDEFMATSDGRVRHEIEWSGILETGSVSSPIA